jgi:uncharacterized protein
MRCSIYKGRKAADTYVYLPNREAVERLSPAVRAALGEPVHVMDLTLTPRRRLARANVLDVMRRLLIDGCYVQLPPKDEDNGRTRTLP